MENFGKESISNSTERKWAAEFKRGERALRMMDGLAKDAVADENVMIVYSLVMCDRRRDL